MTDSPTSLSQSSKTRVRKTSKPLMEKRRRARINASLSQLKTLVLDTCKKDGARYSKLEKSDILELTVKHLQNVQSQHLTAAMVTDPTVASKFHSGFSECVNEVGRYLTSIDGLDPAMRSRLLLHLSRKTQELGQQMTSHVPAQPLFVQTTPAQTAHFPLTSYPGIVPRHEGSGIQTASPSEGSTPAKLPFVQWGSPGVDGHFTSICQDEIDPRVATIPAASDENMTPQNLSKREITCIPPSTEQRRSYDEKHDSALLKSTPRLEQDHPAVASGDMKRAASLKFRCKLAGLSSESVWRPW